MHIKAADLKIESAEESDDESILDATHWRRSKRCRKQRRSVFGIATWFAHDPVARLCLSGPLSDEMIEHVIPKGRRPVVVLCAGCWALSVSPWRRWNSLKSQRKDGHSQAILMPFVVQLPLVRV